MNLSFRKIYDLTLNEDDTAELKSEGNIIKGKWTMVYDEGFDIIFDNFSFFAFSKYTIEKDISKNMFKYRSYCYQTCIGWYKNKDKTKVGCYQAEKVGVDVETMLHYSSKKIDVTIDNKESAITNNVIEPMRFKEKLQKLNEKFNQENVMKINKIQTSWIADTYPEYNKISIRELNQLAGINRKQITHYDRQTFFRFKNGKSGKNLKNKNSQLKEVIKEEEELSQFPKSFDWKHKVRVAGSQGKCGSCYAWATIRMIEARINILYGINTKLSVQSALDCSYYNQGCKGGYSYLVLKFANEFDLVPEECYPYKAVNGKCHTTCDESSSNMKFRVSNYSYLGGSYGKCNEKLMMEELQKNGPFVVSIEPDYEFMFYKSGIYHSVDETSWIRQGLTKPEWQKVDHSVLLVGWGEDEVTKEKYWLIQNSWGEDWGEKGYFRIKRGVDELAVESICEIGSPILVENKTKKLFT